MIKFDIFMTNRQVFYLQILKLLFQILSGKNFGYEFTKLIMYHSYYNFKVINIISTIVMVV